MPVYGLYNGDDMAPPPVNGREFATGHNHYLTTGSVDLDASDLDALLRTVTEHGYGTTPQSRLLLLANPDESEVIQSLRASETNGDGTISKVDFIPSSGAPAYLTDQMIVGDRAPGSFEGLEILGSYGRAWLTETNFMPPGYVVALATSGANSPYNPIVFREHARTKYQGLRVIPGNQQRYPLIDAYYTRGYGVGTRHRGAAAVLQVTASGTYTAPVID